ncbi:MAG: type II toxin-antitoxin system HicA family toxin [Verrucomicrobiales bacterium]|jgi:predicted RNA binding protein YcfA (HicA-like mRNA interferase family)|nr:type II toxin-antitoxin system HicA family toxin [Verrucomicrobiales bacterium]
MAKIFKSRELCQILERLGYVRIRQRGSHAQYRHYAKGVQTTVPLHPGRDIAPGLSRQIAKDIGMTLDELWDLR